MIQLNWSEIETIEILIVAKGSQIHVLCCCLIRCKLWSDIEVLKELMFVCEQNKLNLLILELN